jgi:hypothetical protein
MWKIFSVPCGSALYKFHCIYNVHVMYVLCFEVDNLCVSVCVAHVNVNVIICKRIFGCYRGKVFVFYF